MGHPATSIAPLPAFAGGAPVLAPRFELPTKRDLDAKLLGGSALFGIGWALGGFCSAPAVVSVFGGRSDNFVFFAALVGGMALRKLGTFSLEQQILGAANRSQT